MIQHVDSEVDPRLTAGEALLVSDKQAVGVVGGGEAEQSPPVWRVEDPPLALGSTLPSGFQQLT